MCEEDDDNRRTEHDWRKKSETCSVIKSPEFVLVSYRSCSFFQTLHSPFPICAEKNREHAPLLELVHVRERVKEVSEQSETILEEESALRRSLASHNPFELDETKKKETPREL